MELWAFQKQAIEKLKDKTCGGILFDCGLGKTITAIELVNTKKLNALYIVPAILKNQWQEQIKLYQNSSIKTLVVSIEKFSRGIPSEVYDFIKTKRPICILDESSKIKSNTPTLISKRAKNILAISELCHQKFILTGTFLSINLFNAYNQLKFLGISLPSKWAFYSKYTITMRPPYLRGGCIPLDIKTWTWLKNKIAKVGAELATIQASKYYGISREDVFTVAKQKEFSACKNLDDLKANFFSNLVVVNRKDANLQGDKQYVEIKLPATAEQKKLFKELKETHIINDITITEATALYHRYLDVVNGFVPTEIEGEFKAIGSPKIDALLELLEELPEGEQVVIWCNRSNLISHLQEVLTKEGYSVGRYDGKTKETREQDYLDFQSKTIKILLINQQSGAYGLDGLKECNYAIYISNNSSPELRKQSEDRIARGNFTNAKVVYDIMLENSVDSRIVDALKKGQDLIALKQFKHLF